MTLPKGDLVSFDLRDEHGAALWLPTSDENNRRLAPALVLRARPVLRRRSLPGTFEQDLMRIVATLPSQHEEAYKPFAVAAASIDVKDLEETLCEAFGHLHRDRFWHVRKRWRARRDWGQAKDGENMTQHVRPHSPASRRTCDWQDRSATNTSTCPRPAARISRAASWVRPRSRPVIARCRPWRPGPGQSPGRCRRCRR